MFRVLFMHLLSVKIRKYHSDLILPTSCLQKCIKSHKKLANLIHFTVRDMYFDLLGGSVFLFKTIFLVKIYNFYK